MFKVLTVTAAAVLISTSAYADVKKDLRNAKIEDVYVYEEFSQPTYYENCQNIKVPNKKGASGGDVLGGMIIGGVIGNVIGGNDKGAAVGAILGGIGAAESNKGNGGYRVERQCETVTEYTTKYKKIYSHSIMWFTENGIKRRLEVVLPWK
jgi:uncharacterized protein YcfJ